MTPCLSEGPEEKMVALLGDINIPDPALKAIMHMRMNGIELSADIDPIIYRPILAKTKPANVKILLSNLSDRIPIVGPRIILLIALGTSITPT